MDVLAQPRCQTFEETGKTMCDRFMQYWQSNGGLPQQGYAISEEIQEQSATDGKIYTVQYFERAVFEKHSENQPPNDVLLSLLGNFHYKQKYPKGAPNQTPNTEPGSVLFKETGKRVGGLFLDYWKKNGALPQQGFPISDEFNQVSDLNGRTYKVQYFERAVFEYHPEEKPEYRVLLSQLGTFRYRELYDSALLRRPPYTPGVGSPFGVVGAMRWPSWGTFGQPAELAAQTGTGWVVEDFVWGLIEPKRGQFEWTGSDRFVEALRQRNLNIVGILSYSADWATPSTEDDGGDAMSFYPPDQNLYYEFVRTLVTRYKDKVNYWQVWNEPDNDWFWKPKPNAREYATLLKTAYRAVKDASPNAMVIGGAVSGNAIPFLEEIVAAGSGDSFDILSIHPYAIPLDETRGRIQSQPEVHKIVDVELSKYRSFLQRHNMGKKQLWVTEIGWPANKWQLDEQYQADYLAQAYAMMLSSGLVDKVFWYSFKDEGGSNDNSWGLVRWGNGKTDLAPRRPSFAAYTTSARMIHNTTPGGRVQLAPYQMVDDFEQSQAWTRSTHPNGSFTIGPAQKHSGALSGRFEYNFTGKEQAVDFAPPTPRPISGRPTRLGLWVLGDASGNYLSAWIKDAKGELFKVRLGSVGGAADGWRYFESRINNYYFSWEIHGGDGRVDYPVSFVSFRLENTPDHPARSGVIYVDDLQSYDGPDTTTWRFVRGDGQVVDVLWSIDSTQVDLPTQSGSAQVTDRDGGTRTVSASGGKLRLNVGISPIYVVHRP
jgi:hypothetical protein